MAPRGRSASPVRRKSKIKKTTRSKSKPRSKSRSTSRVKSQTWLTHDNGGRPFKVVIRSNKALIYDNYSKEASKPLLLEFEISDHIIGKSPRTPQTLFSGGHGPKFDGNSILLRLADSPKWVFVGDSIFEFKPLSELIKYVSEVGNNDVPYPYAIDSEGRHYLLGEGVILTKPLPREFNNDPYGYYYKANLITADEGLIPPKQPTKRFREIEKYWQNNTKYTFRWTPRWTKSTKNHFVKYSGDTKRSLISDAEMCKLNRAFGTQRGFRRLVSKMLIKRRW
jgi:hypothetical protein